jgi:hypothetical protein
LSNNPTANWIAGQVTDAFLSDEAPHHLLRDRAFDPAYMRRIRAMRIRDHPTAPRSPWQNGRVERLIGSIRRESLDHLVVFDEAQLRRVLKSYVSYYNQVRPHSAFGDRSPEEFARLGNNRAQPHCARLGRQTNYRPAPCMPAKPRIQNLKRFSPPLASVKGEDEKLSPDRAEGVVTNRQLLELVNRVC